MSLSYLNPLLFSLKPEMRFSAKQKGERVKQSKKKGNRYEFNYSCGSSI